MTPRQAQILAYIRTFTEENGYPPTVREIGDEVGLASPSTVHAHLLNLERDGYLWRDESKPRALRVLTRRGEIPACS